MNSLQQISLIVALLSMLCFAGAIPLYFRKGAQRTAGQRGMLAAIAICGGVQLYWLLTAGAVDPAWSWSGLACFAVAHGLFWSAVIAHGKQPPKVAFADEGPARLIVAGPYRLIRHPFYAAYTLGWIGGALTAGEPWLLLTAVVMWSVYYAAARKEEVGFFDSAMQEAYRDYRRRTGMFVPKIYS